MNFNLKKCVFINFSLKRHCDILHDYFLADVLLKQVYLIKDLGVYFTPKLSFSVHICKTVNKAFRMLGFVKRTLKPFGNVGVYKILYNSFIRSSLDYCSSVWSPHSKIFISKVERVQKKFVKHLCYLTNNNFCNGNYATLCELFQLTTLERRREICDLILFHKILHSKVNCSELLSSVCLNVPSRRTRHTEVLTTRKKCRIVLRKSDFIPRCAAKANTLDQVDFFDSLLTKNMLNRVL